MKTTALGFSILCCAATALAWSEPVHAGQAMKVCSIAAVAALSNRVHIHCAPPGADYNMKPCLANPAACESPGSAALLFFAVESNSPLASQVIQIGLSALINKRKFDILYDDNAGANPVGCQQNDCRRIIGVLIH